MHSRQSSWRLIQDLQPASCAVSTTLHKHNVVVVGINLTLLVGRFSTALLIWDTLTKLFHCLKLGLPSTSGDQLETSATHSVLPSLTHSQSMSRGTLSFGEPLAIRQPKPQRRKQPSKVGLLLVYLWLPFQFCVSSFTKQQRKRFLCISLPFLDLVLMLRDFGHLSHSCITTHHKCVF